MFLSTIPAVIYVKSLVEGNPVVVVAVAAVADVAAVVSVVVFVFLFVVVAVVADVVVAVVVSGLYLPSTRLRLGATPGF